MTLHLRDGRVIRADNHGAFIFKNEEATKLGLVGYLDLLLATGIESPVSGTVSTTDEAALDLRRAIAQGRLGEVIGAYKGMQYPFNFASLMETDKPMAHWEDYVKWLMANARHCELISPFENAHEGEKAWAGATVGLLTKAETERGDLGCGFALEDEPRFSVELTNAHNIYSVRDAYRLRYLLRRNTGLRLLDINLKT